MCFSFLHFSVYNNVQLQYTFCLHFFLNTRLNTFCLIDFVCVFCNAKDSFHLNFNKIRMHWSLLNYRNSYIKCKYNEISLTFFKIDKYQWYLVFVYITFFQNFIFSCAFRNMIDLQFPRTARLQLRELQRRYWRYRWNSE